MYLSFFRNTDHDYSMYSALAVPSVSSTREAMYSDRREDLAPEIF